MCTEPKFFICKHCGNLVGMIHNAGVPMVCCGENMTALIANTVDAAKEKHVPVITVSGSIATVKIGAIDHPMTAEHWIQWVYLETSKGGQRKCLNPGQKPEVSFSLTTDDTVLAAYEYCNLHGLWKAAV